jgi:hypothetical protein
MNIRSALFAGAAAFLCASGTSQAAINFVGVTIPWKSDSDSTADSIGGNADWNVYIRPEGGSFLNDGDGDATRFSVPLDVGTHTFEIFVQHQSWVDDSPPSPGSYINLFFGNRTTPDISAQLAGGNFGALAPLTAADIALVANDEDGSLVSPAGQLLHVSVADGLMVELVGLEMEIIDDTVSAYSAFPSGFEQDSLFRITLAVAIPEPSTGLLLGLGLGGLVFLRRRRT